MGLLRARTGVCARNAVDVFLVMSRLAGVSSCRLQIGRCTPALGDVCCLLVCTWRSPRESGQDVGICPPLYFPTIKHVVQVYTAAGGLDMGDK